MGAGVYRVCVGGGVGGEEAGLAAFESPPPWTTRDPLSACPRIWIGVWSSLNWRLGVDGYTIVTIYGKED